jgi:hypothetical protein
MDHRTMALKYGGHVEGLKWRAPYFLALTILHCRINVPDHSAPLSPNISSTRLQAIQRCVGLLSNSCRPNSHFPTTHISPAIHPLANPANEPEEPRHIDTNPPQA